MKHMRLDRSSTVVLLLPAPLCPRVFSLASRFIMASYITSLLLWWNPHPPVIDREHCLGQLLWVGVSGRIKSQADGAADRLGNLTLVSGRVARLGAVKDATCFGGPAADKGKVLLEMRRRIRQ